MKTLIFILLTTLAISTQASPNRAREVARLFYSAKCNVNCQQGVTLDYYQAKDLYRLPQQLYKTLQKVAYDQAQIWGDTILEGDYAADGNVQIDNVIVIKQSARIVGYAITYSEKAWYTGRCTYVYHNKNSLGTCDEGRIYETSFVSDNLNEAEVDLNQYADFKAKE
jgi:hypothetical protein